MDNFHKCFEKENWKTCTCTFENMCFPITDINHKTCVLKTDFVQGVEGRRLNQNFLKMKRFLHGLSYTCGRNEGNRGLSLMCFYYDRILAVCKWSGVLEVHPYEWRKREMTTNGQIIYYESINRDLMRRLLYEYRCDERLKTKTEESTHPTDTGLVVELEHLKIKRG